MSGRAGVQFRVDKTHHYLAIYEVEADDVADAAKALGEGVAGTMVISPALDRGRTVAWFYTPITERVKWSQ